MTAFTKDYYKFMLTNENTLISPVLGIFTIHLSGNSDQIEPINFVLLKSVIPLSPDISSKFHTMIFDLKGSTYGRRAIKDKTKLPKIYTLEKSILTAPLKDLDFNDGIKSLKLAETHPEQTKLLLDQISRDTGLFSKYNLMDYSLLVFILYDTTCSLELSEEKCSEGICESLIHLSEFPHSFVQKGITVE